MRAHTDTFIAAFGEPANHSTYLWSGGCFALWAYTWASLFRAEREAYDCEEHCSCGTYSGKDASLLSATSCLSAHSPCVGISQNRRVDVRWRVGCRSTATTRTGGWSALAHYAAVTGWFGYGSTYAGSGERRCHLCRL